MLHLLRRHRVLLLHLSFWGVYFSFYYYQFGQEYGWRRSLPLTAVPMLVSALIAYVNYSLLLPRWLLHQQPVRYALEFGGRLPWRWP